MAPRYKKLWMVWSATANRYLTWDECKRVGQKKAQTVDVRAINNAALGARANGFPDAVQTLVTVKVVP